MGWLNSWVLAALIGGVVLLAIFVVLGAKIPGPMFDVGLFRNRAFSAGNLAGALASIGRGGLMFMLIIWLQGIWLAPPWLQLRLHPSVGRDLHAAAHHRVPHRRTGLRVAIRPFRG